MENRNNRNKCGTKQNEEYVTVLDTIDALITHFSEMLLCQIWIA
jgi:hypothetical protein